MLFHVKIETSHDSDIRSAEKTAWRRPCCRRSAGGSGALGMLHTGTSPRRRVRLGSGGKSYIGRVLRLGTQTKAHTQMTRTDSVGNRCTAGLYTATGEHEPPTGCIPRLEART